MRYFGTSFSLTLGAWRLRFSLDLEDAPDESVRPSHHVQAVRTPDARTSRASSSRN
jgi:hypothetical protein